MDHDIFLRAHTVIPDKSHRAPAKVSKWPGGVLILDTETTIDTSQTLTFGVYRICRLAGSAYVTSEEGLFFADDLDPTQREILADYVKEAVAEVEQKSFPPKLKLSLQSRSEFVEKVLWKAIKDARMVVGFNLPFDLSRLAVNWTKARNGGWSLILSLRRSKKTGEIEHNPDRPRIRVTSKDSKSAFLREDNPPESPLRRAVLSTRSAHPLRRGPFRDRTQAQAIECFSERTQNVRGVFMDAQPSYRQCAATAPVLSCRQAAREIVPRIDPRPRVYLVRSGSRISRGWGDEYFVRCGSRVLR